MVNTHSYIYIYVNIYTHTYIVVGKKRVVGVGTGYKGGSDEICRQLYQIQKREKRGIACVGGYIGGYIGCIVL